ncbi:hypothetical protein NEF87_004969 [Candidatus Lokiarchaeum ossiferum]|uniref:Uncharacterized protein n=1 Tax=Candidatus Lokiarchaeum ossiferum TaxID=2951803 RepID=A0ABY6HYS4_9ARCH|nr:hypothetical protein NEF87_004969 [Candidatus Lokiarchaeum sp. B-35]
MSILKKGPVKELENNYPDSHILEDSSVEKHDLYNFEAKMDYQLQNIPVNRYELGLYFFIPRSLQINPTNYSRETFYTDLNNYMRFKTPQIALSGLMNEKNERSPFTKINAHLENITNGSKNPHNYKKIVDELKVLGCVVNVCIRDQIQYFIENPESLHNEEEDYHHLMAFLDQIELLQEKMKKYAQEFILVQIPGNLQEAFRFSDIYISSQIEKHILTAIKKFQSQPRFDETCKPLALRLVSNEKKHRELIDNSLEISKDSSNEKYSYWNGILKKFIQSILYLDIRPRDKKSKALSALYSFAAGIAMFFSILLGFLIVDHYEQKPYAYISALIIVYILKDKLKDSIRNASTRIIAKVFPDRRFEVHDGFTDNKIGTTKETVRFLEWGQIPAEIVNIREATNKTTLERTGKPEIILRYVKNVMLKTKSIQEYHSRHGDINDIIRFNIRHFLQYADDSVQNENIWDEDSQKIISVPCSKVYHINVIFKIRSFTKSDKEGAVYYKKVRVILDQNGIKRIMTLDTKV